MLKKYFKLVYYLEIAMVVITSIFVIIAITSIFLFLVPMIVTFFFAAFIGILVLYQIDKFKLKVNLCFKRKVYPILEISNSNELTLDDFIIKLNEKWYVPYNIAYNVNSSSRELYQRRSKPTLLIEKKYEYIVSTIFYVDNKLFNDLVNINSIKISN